MYKVKQLYVVFDDGDGHKYLIPKDEYESFDEYLNRLKDELDFPIFKGWNKRKTQQSIDELLGSFDTLEGEEVYVVLPNDLIKGEED